MITFREKKLKMVWEMSKDGFTSFLVGTAHFFPYSFKESLIHLISKADVTLFEGPLDENNMEAVREYGVARQDGMSLYDSLDEKTIAELNKELGESAEFSGCSLSSYISVFKREHHDLLSQEIEGLRPWMAFFKLWSHYLAKRGWKHSVDLEALSVSRELGKKVVFLETIEEQLTALDGIPFERIVTYLSNFRNWGKFSRHHEKQYLKGSLDSLLNIISGFPTRCPSIVEHRDPVFFTRMRPYVEAGNAVVFLGTTHIQGIVKMLEQEGFKVSQYSK
ncbi:MAG TPA: TraB/GumN family protein [Syntrophorhabdus sp.]|jgi:uncharacterized protein YbaP (TraB family)|nr:TraB/GumN family protein [Syntrophorhabdus sp.]OPX93266.1 MAG: TraB family protein [Syntrophorhabdus sp. PtaB.Bin027]HOD77731.1 TraB/GumN family protein [Syntrophorhabdus sp.]HQG25292.1 TraB/GumN family protein [Syntrophorhabdus sp.]HQH81970.1 TraB/GumN family protein [Syntrophorhabdus sp.]